MAWLALEVNLIAFVPLIILKPRKYQAESGLKYFITQAIASILILMSVYRLRLESVFRNYLLLGALFLKIGAAPLHQWIITISQGLSWPPLFLLLVPQKIAPMLLTSVSAITLRAYFINFAALARAMTGSIGGLITPSLKKIIAYSSVRHLSWLLMSLDCGKNLWVFYFLVYSFILFTILLTFNALNIKSLSQLINMKKSKIKYLLLINILSLAGMPPFSGFVIKLIILQSLIIMRKMQFAAVLLLATIISLFFYLRIILINTFNSRTKIREKPSTKTNLTFLTIINMRGLIAIYPFILFLDFKLNKLRAFKAPNKGNLKSRFKP